MKQLSLVSVCALALSSLVGCGDPNADNGEPSSTTPPSVTPVAPGSCITETAPNGSLLLRAVDGNNYGLINTVMVKQTEIGPGTDLTLDWSALTVDFFKHEIKPGDVTNITVAMFEFLYDELIHKLETDALGGQATVGVTFPIPADGSVKSVKVLDMHMPYTGGQQATPEQVDPYFDPSPTAADPAKWSYTVTLNQGDLLKAKVKMIHYLHMNPSLPAGTVVQITNESASITATATIASKPAVMIPKLTPGITADWNAMVKNAINEDFLDASIGKIRVLHFPFTPAELETKVLDLEQSFDKEYSGDPTGVEATDLSKLVDKDGVAFPGIDPALGGTWTLALMCRDDICGSPAPWYMARLEACP